MNLDDFKSKLRGEKPAPVEKPVEKLAEPKPAATPVAPATPAAPATRKVSIASLRKTPIPSVKPVGPLAPAPAPSAAIRPKPVELKPQSPVASSALAPTSPLGKLLTQAKARENRPSGDHSLSEISPQASAVFEKGEIFDVQTLLDDWPDPEKDEDYDAEERQDTRNELVKLAVGRLDQVFQTQLQELRVAHAADPIIGSLAQIVNLTFLRVKSSPAALDMLSDGDVATLVRGLRVISQKRQAALLAKKGKRGKGETSVTQDRADLDALNMFGEDALADIGDLDLGFDLEL